MSVNLDQLTCPGCGYALRGLPDNICPECGALFDPPALLEELSRPRVSSERAMLATLASVATALLSVGCTPMLGLRLIADIASSYGVMCGTHLRDESGLMLLGVPAIGIGCFSLVMAMSARKWVAVARAAALATTAAWSTMWLLVLSV